MIEAKAESSVNVAVLIHLKKGVKRSWRYFKSILNNNGYDVDLRKRFTVDAPISIECDYCGDKLEIS